MKTYPYKHSPQLIVLITIVVVFLAVSLIVNTGPAYGQQGEALFIETVRRGSQVMIDSPSVTRSRYVDVDFAAFEDSRVGDLLVLNLFADQTMTAVIDGVDLDAGVDRLVTGHLPDIELSQVVLIENNGQLVGNISSPQGFYQIRYAGDGVHAIRAIDQSAFPPEAEPLEVNPAEITAAEVHSNPQSASDDGSRIDVMMVYTSATRAAAGGTPGIQNEIALAVAETNQSYANSGINQRLYLVHSVEVDYTESGNFYTYLDHLQRPSDGVIDHIHGLRDSYQADVVVMLVETGNYCGLAYVMSNVASYFQAYAFSVVLRDCATGYYSFGHELGHNMGARHDWYEDDTNNSPYSYNHGTTNPPDHWRTIMAYSNECTDSGAGYCSKIQYWSTPNLSINGDPLGVPAGTSTACVAGDLNHPDCDADNRLTLNNTANTVANFRQGSTATVGPVIFNAYTIDDDSYDSSYGNGDGILNCGEEIELQVSLLNDGTEPVVSVNATIGSDGFYIDMNGAILAYPDIPGQASSTSSAYFTFMVDPATPDGYSAPFEVTVTASNGGPWVDTFNIPVTCLPNAEPYTPDNPVPADNATDVWITADLGWTGGDPDFRDSVTYDVYFEAGDNTPDDLLCNDALTPDCNPGTLAHGTQYYWYVVASDGSLTTTSPIWDFVTESNSICYPLTLAYSGSGAAPIASPVNSTSCSSGEYLAGEIITLTPVYDAGWTLDHWMGTLGSTISRLKMPEGAHTVTAYYVELPETVIYMPVVVMENVFEAPESNAAPYVPQNPNPANGSTGQSTTPDLSWAGGDPDGDRVYYDLYLDEGDRSPARLVSYDQTSTVFSPVELNDHTLYTWQVVARDEHGAVTPGPLWQFTTGH